MTGLTLEGSDIEYREIKCSWVESHVFIGKTGEYPWIPILVMTLDVSPLQLGNVAELADLNVLRDSHSHSSLVYGKAILQSSSQTKGSQSGLDLANLPQ